MTNTFLAERKATGGWKPTRGLSAPTPLPSGTAFGLKASYDWKVGGILIKPEIRAAWQHEYGDAAYALDSSFANGAGNTLRSLWAGCSN